jgi:hypothetical protein
MKITIRQLFYLLLTLSLAGLVIWMLSRIAPIATLR